MNISKNTLGTTTLTIKFKGMKKEQEFNICKNHYQSKDNKIVIQSESRIGYIDLTDGSVFLCKPTSGKVTNYMLHTVVKQDTINNDQLDELLKVL